ncbi:MAG TPA: Gfo/Idh/MocA family oxidoreductase [Roseimicrobium sp.]|nr:Gfo/Idh/MocA family oxidoreductase [Roseimicrobium sp.]
MSPDKTFLPSRRQFLQTTGGLAAASMLPSFAFPSVHVQGSEVVQVALVGCGGRGGGAAANALMTTSGPVKLVAMADVFEDRLKSCHDNLLKDFAAQMVVPAERQFLGFDAYKQAMDLLKPGDVVILTTPPAFRGPHFEYAISKKLNIFMEKPLTTDGATARRMLKLADEAEAANLKVGVGLMSRHTIGLQELHKRVTDGEIGDVLLMRGYRMHGPAASFESTPKPDGMTHLEYQIRRFHSFLWASGGCFNDFYIHHVDHLCWMKNEWPVSAQASGWRHYRMTAEGVPLIDQNFDNYSVEYTFTDGTKFYFEGRCVEGAHGQFSSYLHGTKGSAIAARSGDCGGPAAIYDGQTTTGTPKWQTTDKSNPYENEWDVLMVAIRENKPHNEVKSGVAASVTASMGRMAAHTGQVVTYDQMLNSEHVFAPTVDTLTLTSDSPLMPLPNGKYPVPQPGILIDREY